MKIQHKNIAKVAVILACSGIVLGAFGAHGLESILSPPKIESFQVGIRYQIYHALALLILSLIDLKSTVATAWVYKLFLIGTVLFSGSIYVLSFTQAWNFSPGPLVFLTPLGGTLLIVGWIRLFIAIHKNANQKT